ncbi:MFS transporter [Staphylococcus chromogenes]|nr:MFS transporter [Staphylococcus chromogenes]
MNRNASFDDGRSVKQQISDAQAPLVAGIVFLAFMGQMLLNPLIAPLSRELGLREWHIGAAISLAAAVLAMLSPLWGQVTQKWGVKLILASGMALATCALLSFAVVAAFGMKHQLTGMALVIGVLGTRGLVYGAGIAAVAPAAQTHVVTQCASEDARVKGIGMIGAAQGMAAIVGGLVGGALAAAGGLLVPLYAMPLVMGAGIAILLGCLRAVPVKNNEDSSQKVSFRDPRILPWLSVGLVILLVFSSVSTIFGFTVQDRFGLEATETAGVTAIYLTVMGLSMVIGQAVIVPRLRWGARKLLRGGLLLLILGIACMWPVSSHALLVASMLLTGLGMGLALPGYSTGPTLAASDNEQGAVAGLINATNGLAYTLAPIVSTALYGWKTLTPFILCLVLGAAGCLYSQLHPSFRD